MNYRQPREGQVMDGEGAGTQLPQLTFTFLHAALGFPVPDATQGPTHPVPPPHPP